jgi:hypothetical protein
MHSKYGAGKMTQITDLIKKHNELQEYIDEETKAFDERMKPYIDGVETILGHMQGVLLKEIQDPGKPWVDTPKASIAVKGVGTAYLSTFMSVKVDNQTEFRKLCAENWDFADLRCRKEPVKDWLIARDGELPPGVNVQFVTKCHIRRT